MKDLLKKNMLVLGCLDTWLISKLTNGNVFVTEPSSASSTGIFDPFVVNIKLFFLKNIIFRANGVKLLQI